MKNGSNFGNYQVLGAISCVVFFLAACGGAKPSNTDPIKEKEVAQAKLTQLEESRVIPNLERSPTLQGIDLNRNGVRDDIERYIEQKYTVDVQRKAAMQMAKSMQATVTVDLSDSSALNALNEPGFRAVVCLMDVLKQAGVEYPSKAVTEIESLTTNTKARLQAYLAYNKAMSGSVSKLPEGNTCD